MRVWAFACSLLLPFLKAYSTIETTVSKTEPNFFSACQKKSKSSHEWSLLPFQSNYIFLTTNQTPNGMGVFAHHLLYAAAYAFYRQWNFGGLITDTISDSHFVSGILFNDFLFGTHEKVLFSKIMHHANQIHQNLLDERFTNPYPVSRIYVEAVDFYSQLHLSTSLLPVWTPDNGTVLHLPNIDNFFLEKIIDGSDSPIDTFLTEECLSIFRRQASCGVETVLNRRNYFAESESWFSTLVRNESAIDTVRNTKSCSSSNVSISSSQHSCGSDIGSNQGGHSTCSRIVHVAAHLRRGDSHRGPPLTYYFSVISSLVVLFPNCLSVHFFSEDMAYTERQRIHERVETIGNGQMVINKTFYIHNHISLWKRNLTLSDVEDADLVGDEETTMETLTHIAHFITADVFITSFSSFSFFAALYNPRCVVHAMSGVDDQELTSMYTIHRPLSSWITAHNYSNNSEIHNLITSQIPLCLNQNA